jgi:hypothetical protein
MYISKIDQNLTYIYSMASKKAINRVVLQLLKIIPSPPQTNAPRHRRLSKH